MSLAVVHSRALCGMEAPSVSVEVHLANGLPAFHIVGLPDAEVRESKERVRSALQNAGFDTPPRRITVNLAPADLPKESGRFDLPIAVGILAASGQLSRAQLDALEFAGELSLTGQLRPIRGALAMALSMQRRAPPRAFVLPRANADEAALAAGACVYPASTLAEVCALLSKGATPSPHTANGAVSSPRFPDLADVKGQQHAKRALLVAAAGGHSVLMIGPPGSGKTMLAARFPGLLPPMTEDEALQAAAVHSLNGTFTVEQWRARPYRAPHHTASAAALVGGGTHPRPGEVSLAHCGVLFLDELPEFDRRVLEVLRQPMESGTVTIARALGHVDYPARFQLIAAMNPCPCGYLAHPSGNCHCSPDRIARYQDRVSGPLLDRIDIHIEVGPLAPDLLASEEAGEPSEVVSANAARAALAAIERQGKPNQQLGSREIDRYCKPNEAGEDMLRRAMQRFQWSARAYHRVLRVARTVADLDGAVQVGEPHVSEAVGYRRGLFRRTGTADAAEPGP